MSIYHLQELLRFLFREAKIHNAILFFDECECLFESRNSRPNPSLGILLTEVGTYGTHRIECEKEGKKFLGLEGKGQDMFKFVQ